MTAVIVDDDWTAAASTALRARKHPIQMVVFDCDGVLIDSEPISARVLSDALRRAGWALTPEETNSRFLGQSIRQIVPKIEAHIGRSLPQDWVERLRAGLLEALANEAPLVPGAREAIAAVEAAGLPWRVASNSSHEEMAAKFGRNGLAEKTRGRVHSHRDVAAGKPAPDLYLAAAAAQGIPPAECLVIEDSTTGIRAAKSAGMDVLALVRHGDGAGPRALGALPIRSLSALPRLLHAAHA